MDKALKLMDALWTEMEHWSNYPRSDHYHHLVEIWVQNYCEPPDHPESDKWDNRRPKANA